MTNYSVWEEKTISVASLKLDALNPRLSHINHEITQNELINEMINNYKIYDLAQSIAENGFFPDKNLIAVKIDKTYVVVEGNRRLSALKALLTPEIITSNEKNKFLRLNSVIEKSFIDKVKIIIAPSREDANPIVFKEHTDKTSMPWSRIMQAEFYRKQIEENHSIDEISSIYNKPKSEILSFLKLINMYDIACILEYSSDEIKKKVYDKQTFNASVLERIYDSQEMKNFLKFEFEADGQIKGQTKKEDFKKAYTKVVEDIVTGKINTRILNTKQDFKEYVGSIRSFEPKGTGRFTQSQLIDGISKPVEKPVKNELPSKKTIQQSSGVIQKGVPFTLEGATNLKQFYDELKKIPVKTYHNSAAVTLRVFLEKTLRVYLPKRKINKIVVIRDGVEKDIKLSDCGLGEIIDYLISRDVAILEDNTKKILRQFKNSSNSVSLSALNSVVHNEDFTLTEKEVRDIWTKLECLFKEILLEPGK